MPREVVALVSADDLVAAVRVHADRVHDLLRRSGCGPEESVEVCESYAFGLIDAVVNAPETVGDMAGWWFGRALELGRRLGDAASEPVDETEEASASVLSGTSGESQVRAALAGLPEPERAAVVLRDAYDLPPQAVAVALRRDVDSAATLVAAGRLDLVARYDDRRVPDLLGHNGRTPADLGTLGRLADGSLPPPKMVPLRRHLSSCSACEDVVEVLARARRLAAALPVVALPDEAREAMLERVEARAVAVLPSVEEVLQAIEQDGDDRPAVSPMVIVLAVVLALVLGVAVAAASSLSGGGEPLSLSSPQPEPTEQPSFSVSAAPTKKHKHRATPSSSATPSRTASAAPTTASPTATASASSQPAVARISISPTSGGSGTTITVTGRGWEPGSVVTVTYSGNLVGSSRTSVTAGDNGRFTGEVTANGTLPGRYTVKADNGSQTASAPFRQTS